MDKGLEDLRSFEKVLGSHLLARIKVEQVEEWEKWRGLIPYIEWPQGWKVRAIPPFAGAIIRYNIKTPQCDFVSVYLDCYDRLGVFGTPYWEVYPHEGDVYRCAMEETDKLLKAISGCKD